MNINISVASEPPEHIIIREALSEYPFYRFTCKVDSYTGLEKVMLTVGDKEYEGTLSGMDVSVDGTGALLYNAGAVDSACPVFDEAHPVSFRDTPISDIIANYGFEIDGPEMLSAEMSILNMSHSDADMVLALANMGSSPAFVDFKNKKITFLSRLYKQKPVDVLAGFQGTYSRPLSVGYTLSEPNATLYGGKETPNVVLEGGRPITHAAGVMASLVKNYNDLAALWSKKQTFTTDGQDIPVGSMVVSALTDDKRLVVAKEAVYTPRGARFTYWVV
jgi:hypothetical protein